MGRISGAPDERERGLLGTSYQSGDRFGSSGEGYDIMGMCSIAACIPTFRLRVLSAGGLGGLEGSLG